MSNTRKSRIIAALARHQAKYYPELAKNPDPAGPHSPVVGNPPDTSKDTEDIRDVLPAEALKLRTGSGE